MLFRSGKREIMYCPPEKYLPAEKVNEQLVNSLRGVSEASKKAFDDAEINLTDKSIKARQNYYNKKNGIETSKTNKSSKGGIISSGTKGRSGRKRTGRKISVKRIKTKISKTKIPKKPKLISLR